MARADQIWFLETPSSSGVGTLTESVTKALNIVRRLPPQVEVKEYDKEGKVVMRVESQPAVIFLYRNLSLLFSTAGWVETRLRMKQLKSEKSTMYV